MDTAYRSLVRVERRVSETSEEFTRAALEWLQADIRQNWSPSSVSAIGSPPAKDLPKTTGNLDSAIFIQQQVRGSLGRFATNADHKYGYLSIDTARGSNPKNRGGYSQALEFGVPSNNLQPRPFLQPAVERLAGVYPDLAKRYIKTR